MKVLYSSLIIASFLMVFFASTGFAASSSGMKAPQQPPQHLLLPSNKLLSPPEFELQKKKMLEQAIAKRKKLGFPVDPERTRVMKAEEWQHYVPERKYTKQSCYHVAYTKDPDDRVFCNAERCTFANGQYCEQKSRDCYDEDGTLILDEKGLPAIDNEQNLFLKWDLCLTHDGAPQPPPGEKPYDERIQTGCAYRVGKRTHPYYDGYRGYLMTCDAGRCLFHPGGAYNRETKMFTDGIVGETKTPPVEYWPYLEWKCIPPKAVHRIAKKYRCSIVTENDENWGCAVSFENGQHVYRSCKNNYNEKGEIVGTRVRVSDALLEQLEALPPFRDRQMEKDRPNRSIMNAVTDLEIFFHQTSVSDAAQEKVVVLFENFFNRHNDEAWSDAQLNNELALLKRKISLVVKKSIVLQKGSFCQ